LKLKLEELVVNVLTNPKHSALAAYFTSIYKSHYPSLKEIMESNFNSSLSLTELARLAARSLSTFRRDFQKIYGSTPSRWLREKRLDYCRHLLETTQANIEEVAYEGGFVSRTHFIRCFHDRFGVTPSGFRKSREVS
jgi:transcriptional regulator GlxA family with amidase domain